MRTLALALVLAGCGGASSSSSSSGTLTLTGNGTITASSASVTASTNENVPLSAGALPSGLTFTFSGGGRIVSADLAALVSAFGGKSLDALTGDELDPDQVLTGAGTLAYGGAPVQNLSFAYVVQGYDIASQPFLTMQISASSAGTSVYGSLMFARD